MSANPEPVELRERFGVGIDYSTALSALSAPRSRYLLAYLNEEGTTVDLEDAARNVAAWELGCDPGQIPEDAEQKILTSLYHAKAPKLAQAGLIDFDPDELTVGVSDVGAQFDGLAFLPTLEKSA